MKAIGLSVGVVVVAFIAGCGGNVALSRENGGQASSPSSEAATDAGDAADAVSEASTDAGDSADAFDAQAPIDAQDGEACSIAAATYDQSCATDSDCTVVVIGGNVCDPCGQPYFFVCPNAVMNVDASAGYNASLASALGQAPGIQYSELRCGTAVSCPTYASAQCRSGTCTLVGP